MPNFHLIDNLKIPLFLPQQPLPWCPPQDCLTIRLIPRLDSCGGFLCPVLRGFCPLEEGLRTFGIYYGLGGLVFLSEPENKDLGQGELKLARILGGIQVEKNMIMKNKMMRNNKPDFTIQNASKNKSKHAYWTEGGDIKYISQAKCS